MTTHDCEQHHYVYGTNRHTGTIHLIRFRDTAIHTNPAAICGRTTHGGFDEGDETLSGQVATCGRCRQLAHLYPEVLQ